MVVLFDYEMPEMTMGPSRMGFFPFDREAGGIGGAIVKVDDFLPARQGSLVYLRCGDDLAPVLSRVDDAGGKVLLDKTLIAPDIGYFATFLDTEGNKVALHSPH